MGTKQLNISGEIEAQRVPAAEPPPLTEPTHEARIWHALNWLGYRNADDDIWRAVSRWIKEEKSLEEMRRILTGR